jgi:hypothetical protein
VAHTGFFRLVADPDRNYLVRPHVHFAHAASRRIPGFHTGRGKRGRQDHTASGNAEMPILLVRPAPVLTELNTAPNADALKATGRRIHLSTFLSRLLHLAVDE